MASNNRAGSDWRRAAVTALLLAAPAAGAHAQSGLIDVGDARIYYETAGRGAAVVLIHGWALNLREWDDQVVALAPRFRVVGYDRRRFGQSTGSADISADSGDLRTLLDTLGIASAVLVGHSGGAQVAFRFAAAFAERVDGLVLYGAGAPPEGFPIQRREPRPNLAAVAR
jgi:pimeloyl-[acyl-carrier protein] methyl ester esterase